MTGWFIGLGDESKAAALKEAERISGIPAKAVEKDLWVTLSLKALFGSGHSHSFVFKGGTSLSKGWRLIERFSEDIDIALDPAVFGYGHPPPTLQNIRGETAQGGFPVRGGGGPTNTEALVP